MFSINTSTGIETVLYSFTGRTDGATPEGTVAVDDSGNIYGTTTAGGAGYGTLFELTPSGTFSVLHTFCPVPGCADGAVPTGSLAGNSTSGFYGTTSSGGAYGKGVAFELVP